MAEQDETHGVESAIRRAVSLGARWKERYEPLEMIGEGSQGQVYRALDHQHGRVVALKVRAVGSAHERTALLSEARILLGLRPHAGVPLVRDDFFIDDRYVIVMDWIDGTNLAHVIEQRGDPGLATGTAIAYLVQVAGALDHLHSHQPPIVHGDVKPANCVLTPDGRVVLVDFGISSWGGERRVGSGTRGYLAPEVAAGDLPTPAADIFGLAATTFALLDGAAPGTEGNIGSSVHPLAAAVRRGLAIDPARRPASAGELVQRLRARHEGDLPVGVVTFMLTDIEGSTAMWDTNPDAMAEALARHEVIIADVVDNRRGRLIKSAGEGDATLSVFIRATDAVAAAIELQRVLAAEAWPDGLAVRVRVALHTGEAQLRDGDYFGTTVNRAARLRGLAVGGEVMVSQATYQVVADQLPPDALVRDLGRHQLKGLSRDEQVFGLEHPDLVARHATGLARVMPVVPLPRALTRDEQAVFVGRETELAALRASWAAAGAGRCSISFIAGEPGIGKSSLVTHLVDGAHTDGALVLAGRCDEGLAVPYKPFVEALRWHVEHAEDQDLVATLGKWPGELRRLLPELTDRVPGLPAPLSSDPQTERWRLFESVASWLGASSADRPLLLALEDLHWAATPTLQLLRHVATSDHLGRAFLLATYRDTEVSEPLAETIAHLRREGAATIVLRGLDESAVAALVTATAGHTLDDRGRLLARVVHDATGGVPLFVREVLAHLAETGAIYLENGRWTSDLVADQLAVPEIARDVIRRRLSHLDAPVRAVLSAAAVVGLEVELAVLQRCFTNGDALAGLERAAGAGLVQQVGPGLYRFAHALIRQAVYDETTAPRRRVLHASVGEAIEQEHAIDLDPYLGVLAQHFTLAESKREQALSYMLRAGNAALAQQAHDDAIGLFEGAVELIDPADRAQRCDALIGLADAQRRAGGAVYRDAAFAAGELAQQLGDGERLTRAALVLTRPTADMTVDLPGIALFETALDLLAPTDSTLRARAMAALGLKLIKADSDVGHRIRLSDDALAMARRLGDLRTLGDVLSGRNNTIWFPDSVAPERLANLSELGAIAETLGDPHLAALAQAFAPSSHVQLGDGDAADASLEALEQIAGELGQPLFVWVARVQRAMRALGTGRLAEAERLMIDALAAGEAAGDPDAIVWYGAQLFGLAWFRGELDGIVETLQPLLDTDVDSAAIAGLSIAYLALGRAGEASGLMAPVLESRFADIPKDATWLSVITAWAHVAAQLDDVVAARVLTELLLPFAGQVDATAALDKGPVAFYLGLLGSTLGEWDDAEKWFTAARHMCDRLRSIWGPRVRYGWARMRVLQGKDQDALALAAEGLELAVAMEVPADIETGERLVRELSRD